MNTPVNFEIAKLLKEKGFHPSKLFGYISKFYHPNTKTLLAYGRTGKTDLSKAYFAPTIAEVVMWLYEKYGIWIKVTPIPYSDNLTHWRWEYTSTNYATRNTGWKKEKDYMSPTETYEAAIEYCLTKLI